MKEEGLQDTDNKLIHIGRPIELDERLFFQQLKQLEEASKEENKDIRPLIHESCRRIIIRRSDEHTSYWVSGQKRSESTGGI